LPDACAAFLVAGTSVVARWSILDLDVEEVWSPVRVTLEGVVLAFFPRVPVGRALAHTEWLTLANVAEVLLQGAPHDVTAEQTADNVEAFLRAGRSRRAWRVRVLLELIEVMPLATHGARFSVLSRERRRALIESKWVAGHNLWRVCSKVRNLVILGAYGDRRAAAKTGYVPVPLRPRFQKMRVVPPESDVA
jgi:hypothetical protein